MRFGTFVYFRMKRCRVHIYRWTHQCLCTIPIQYFPDLYHGHKEYLRSDVDDSLQSGSYNVELVRRRMSKLLEKYCSGLWMSKLSVFYGDMFKENLHPHALIDMAKWTDICIVSYPQGLFITWSNYKFMFSRF